MNLNNRCFNVIANDGAHRNFPRNQTANGDCEVSLIRREHPVVNCDHQRIRKYLIEVAGCLLFFAKLCKPKPLSTSSGCE
jgi:hypothetical protein